MNFINLTPHDINVITDKGSRVIPRSGNVARVNQVLSLACKYDGISIVNCKYGQVENLPEEKEMTYFIVSKMVKDAAPNRQDLLSPGELVRNEKGEVIGCKNFIW